MEEANQVEITKVAGKQGEAVVDIEGALVESIRRRLKELPGKARSDEPFTIFRVPASIRQRAPDLYEPSMVAIGPYHRGNPDLRAMEEHKWRYLRDLLSRREESSLEACVSAVKALEGRARRCYAEDVGLDTKEFAEMLLLDGCFIIELIIKQASGDWETMLRVGWSWPTIQADLLKLENQIPFFVLDTIYNLILARREPDGSPPRLDARSSDLRQFAVEYLMCNKERRHVPASINHYEFDHVLHLYHRCFVPVQIGRSNTPLPSTCFSVMANCLIVLVCFPFRAFRYVFVKTRHLASRLGNRLIYWLCSRIPRMRSICTKVKYGFYWFWPCLRRAKHDQPSASRSLRAVPSATELQEAGVVFKRKILNQKELGNAAGSFLDITFSGGTMEIPLLEVYNQTKPIFVNLIAFEQCNARHKNLTSYTFFMDGLVNTDKDVAVLRQCGVIANNLSSNEELATFINQLCECSALSEYQNYLGSLSSEVWGYYESRWPRWRAKLMHDYFGSPWAILSLVAAVFLLALTIVQTFFTVFAYFRPPT